MSSYQLDHLQYLETESIHIMREVAAEFERPTLLFSGGKDSICLLRLAEKAFRPSDIPMPFLNVDTGHHFPELNTFRDHRARELGGKLIVRKVEDAIASGDKEAARAAFVAAQPEMHRGVTKGVLHKNTVARKLSRLSSRIKSL